MLVESMNYVEINREIYKDYAKLLETSILRLGAEYDRERRKLKIDKTRTYTREYMVKTASKNTWLIMLRKAPSNEIYTGTSDLQTTCVVWFYRKEGIWVFNGTPGDILPVYTAHFFNRYNERLQLNLSKPVDIIRHFFRYNAYTAYTNVPGKGLQYFTGYCRDGIVFAVLANDLTWLVHRTFVSRNLLFPNQDEAGKKLNTSMYVNMVKGLNEVNKIQPIRRAKEDNFRAINGLSMD